MRKPTLCWGSGLIQEPPETASPGDERRWLGRQALVDILTLCHFCLFVQLQEGLGGGLL